MSSEIAGELYFLLHSCLLGIVITVLYDVLRILRRMIPHPIAVVSLEDFCYWIFCSLLIFAMLIRENNGVLRWFAVAGAMAGMIFYKKTLGNFMVRYLSLFFRKVLYLVGKLLRFLFKPLYLVARQARRQQRRAAKPLKMGLRRIKKKLTDGKKMLKIVLCKR